MSKNDIDVGIVFQKEELEELITAIELAKTITNIFARGRVFAAQGLEPPKRWKDRQHPLRNKTVKDMLESWENEYMGYTISAHLNVLREVIDNETN